MFLFYCGLVPVYFTNVIQGYFKWPTPEKKQRYCIIVSKNTLKNVCKLNT